MLSRRLSHIGVGSALLNRRVDYPVHGHCFLSGPGLDKGELLYLRIWRRLQGEQRARAEIMH